MFRLIVTLRRLAKRLWVRVTLFAVLAFLSVAMSFIGAPLVPAQLAARVGPDAVKPILSILASSMLAVSTFSLATMVSAHRAAADTATPRVMRLLTADTTTHTVLAIFIGAFVYALTALILLYVGYVGEPILVLGVTLLVTGAVVLAMIRWIAHLTELGTLADVLARTEYAARTALATHRKHPALGAHVLTEENVIPTEAKTLDAPKSGILQMIDVAGLARCNDGLVWVLRRPGQVVLEGMPLLQYVGQAKPADLFACFVIGHSRTFEQDPAFTLTVLSEIASRALSPAVNDPGTAIEVISRLESLLWDWARLGAVDPTVRPTVFVPSLKPEDLVNAAFDAIARDGAAMIEVSSHLLDALSSLGHSADPELAVAAQALAVRARAHTEAGLTLDADRLRLPQVG